MDTSSNIKSERDKYNNFLNACKYGDVNAIRYHIDVVGIDHISIKGFYYVCRYNNVDVIRYFIEVLGIDHMSAGGFESACMYNSSVDVIKYFIEKHSADPNKGFTVACRYNKCVDMIRYLNDVIGYHQNNNGFEYACGFNSSVNVIKYFIEECRRDPIIGFWYACRFNKVPTIRYFIEEHHSDPNNGFLIACQYNKCVDVIGYFIEEHHTNQNNGFLIACQYNHINVIKYFIEVYSVDYIVGDGFKHACWCSSSVDVIRYFIEVLKINCADYRGFERVCASNSSVDIIRYFIEEQNSDPYIGFYIACRFNSSVDVIRYFIEDLKLDPYKSDTYCNSFEYVCSFNKSFEIFKYFVEDLSIDINRMDHRLDTTHVFLMACHIKRNMDIIRYMIDVLRVDVNMRDDIGEDVISYAKKNNDMALIKYIINHTNYIIGIDLDNAIYIDNLDTLQQNVEKWNDKKFCQLEMIEPEEIISAFNQINQLLLTKEQIRKYNLVDPFSSSMEWNIFKNKVECVKRINKSHDHQMTDHLLNGYQMNRMDDEKIFTNNGIQYYGNRLITYNQIVPLKCVLEMNTEDGFDLNQNISDYGMKLYLSKVEQSVNRFHLLDKKDFVGYIRLLDQYPLPNHTIDRIEIDILEYMINNQIPVDYLIIDMIERYNLRYLYAWMHNKLNCN